MDPVTGGVTGDVVYPFRFPLTLAFFQFAFMSVVFLSLWFMLARHGASDLARVRENIFSTSWTSLVVTHVFSTFWLQALIMPGQMMSLGVFAASRAIEVPAAAVMRSKIVGSGGRFRGHSFATVALMSSAAWLLTYSYTNIAECLCIWSGHGVELAGIALFSIYALVLILPAANVVFLEDIMVKTDVNPLLMLASVNILASLFFVPVLLFAHLSQWEDVGLAFHTTLGERGLYMMVIWLCVQMALTSVVGVTLISLTDSFWTVSFRSLRVVYWWCSQLSMFFLMSEDVLSVARPNTSFWGFIMLLGTCVMGLSLVVDKTPTLSEGVKGQDSTVCGLMGREKALEKAAGV